MLIFVVLGSVVASHPLTVVGMTQLNHFCPLMDNDKSFDGFSVIFCYDALRQSSQSVERGNRWMGDSNKLWQYFEAVKEIHKCAHNYVIDDKAIKILADSMDRFSTNA